MDDINRHDNPNARVSEFDVSFAVLRVLSETDGGAASMDQLIKECPKYLYLSQADLATTPTRAEPLWAQLVRNIIVHQDAAGNFVNDGYLQPTKDGLHLTDSGRSYLRMYMGMY